jgi:hypothetical protein
MTPGFPIFQSIWIIDSGFIREQGRNVAAR